MAKNDGLINFVEPNLGFLPEEMEKDELSYFLRLLIMKVKEEHALYQYKKELKNYAPDIMHIMSVARKNGYKVTNLSTGKASNTEDEEIKPASATYSDESEKPDTEIDYDKIVDS